MTFEAIRRDGKSYNPASRKEKRFWRQSETYFAYLAGQADAEYGFPFNPRFPIHAKARRAQYARGFAKTQEI